MYLELDHQEVVYSIGIPCFGFDLGEWFMIPPSPIVVEDYQSRSEASEQAAIYEMFRIVPLAASWDMVLERPEQRFVGEGLQDQYLELDFSHVCVKVDRISCPAGYYGRW